MKVIKECHVSDVFISSKESSCNYYDKNCVICGRMDCQEFRILTQFNLDTIRRLYKIKDNVKKVQLCMYLIDIKKEKHINDFMINIGINLTGFEPQKVNYCTAPNAIQEPCFYKIDLQCKNRYINFDITNFVKKWLEGEYGDYGLTMMSISDGGAAIFANSRSEKQSYIKVSYDKEIGGGYDEGCGGNVLESSPAYGHFTNISGKFIKKGNNNIICWNKAYNSKNIKIGDDCSSIIVEGSGIYQIDYSVNLRSNCRTCMLLILNESEIASSMVQVGCEEHMSSGFALLHIKNECAAIRLAVKKTDIILASIGNAASIRIIKIA